MDYTDLADEFLKSMLKMRKMGPQQKFHAAMQGEAFVLHYVSMHDGEVLPSQISQELNVSSARVAAALGSLESKGLLTRRIDPNDRRRILVSLTDAGREQTGQHRQHIRGMAAEMLRMLGEQDAREYVRLTKKLATLSPGCAGAQPAPLCKHNHKLEE